MLGCVQALQRFSKMSVGMVLLCLKNKYRIFPLFYFLTTPFIFLCHIILMKPELIADFLIEKNLYKLPRWGILLILERNKNHDRQYPADKC